MKMKSWKKKAAVCSGENSSNAVRGVRWSRFVVPVDQVGGVERGIVGEPKVPHDTAARQIIQKVIKVN